MFHDEGEAGGVDAYHRAAECQRLHIAEIEDDRRESDVGGHQIGDAEDEGVVSEEEGAEGGQRPFLEERAEVGAHAEACDRRVEGVEDVEQVMDADEPEADPEYAVAPHHLGVFAIARHHQGDLGHREGKVLTLLPDRSEDCREADQKAEKTSEEEHPDGQRAEPGSPRRRARRRALEIVPYHGLTVWHHPVGDVVEELGEVILRGGEI